MSPMRDSAGAAQKAAHIPALNFGWVCVSVMGQGCAGEGGGSITRDVSGFVTGLI
jgi:hypothetical protein